MKKIITFFALILLVATAQSQSLTAKDITGSWLVVKVENSNSNPKVAKALNQALLSFNANKSFQIKVKQESNSDSQYKVASKKDATWSYNESKQTITTTRKNMTFKVSKKNEKLFFVDQNSGLKFEVKKA
jgi:hypothetical protein